MTEGTILHYLNHATRLCEQLTHARELYTRYPFTERPSAPFAFLNDQMSLNDTLDFLNQKGVELHAAHTTVEELEAEYHAGIIKAIELAMGAAQ